ncbi:MAG: TonB-dependent receptor [Pseudomonadota bacterium]
MKLRSSLFITAALSIVPSIVQAQVSEEQASASDNVPERDIVVVTALRVDQPASSVPAMVSVIDQEALKNQLTITQDFQALLGNLAPGFAPSRQKLSGFGESFRGRSALYLVDGVPQSNPVRNGSRDGYTIDINAIERIEVINGANAIQGLGATGGIVNYVTRQADPSGLLTYGFDTSITADDGFDSDGFEYRLGGYVGQDFGAFDILAAASYHQRNLYFDGDGRSIGVDGVQGDLADSDQRNVFVKFGFEPDENQRFQIMVNDFELESNGDFSTMDGDFAADLSATASDVDLLGQPPINDVTTISASYSHKDLLGGKFDAQLFFQDFEAVFGGGVFNVFQDPAIAPDGTLFEQSSNQSEKLGIRLSQTYDDLFGNGTILIFGVDGLIDETQQALVQTGRNWVPTTEYENIAPFVQITSPVTERLTLAAGLRWENSTLQVDDFNSIAGNRRSIDFAETPVDGGSPSFDELLLNGSVVYEVIDGLSVYASYAEGYTIADVGRVLRGINEFGVDVDSLLSLEPVVADNLEFGLEYNNDRLSFQLAYYESRSDLGARLTPDADGVFSVSREKTKINGFEATADFDVTNAVTIGGNLSIPRGEVDTDDDGNLDADLDGINIAPDRLNLYASYVDGSWSARLQTSTQFDRDFDDAMGNVSSSFDGYTIADAVISYDFNIGALSLASQNLFDERYVTYFSQVSPFPRNDRFFTGRGRTITLRWTSDF